MFNHSVFVDIETNSLALESVDYVSELNTLSGFDFPSVSFSVYDSARRPFAHDSHPKAAVAC